MRKLKKMLCAVILTSLLALAFAQSTPAITGDPERPGTIVWSVSVSCCHGRDTPRNLAWDVAPVCLGTATTESGELVGNLEIVKGPSSQSGTAVHFTVTLTLTTTEGSVIYASGEGGCNPEACKYWAKGTITDVSDPDLEYLLSYEFRIDVTSETVGPNCDMQGTGKMILFAP